ncbi:MAG: type II secretion system protein [Actinomycetota bacterium]
MHTGRNTTKRRRHDDIGFTLVELLIVIVILGILATVTVFAVRGITDQGQDNAEATDLRTLRTAVESYYALNQTNPADEAALVTAGLLREQSTIYDYTLNGDGTYTITDIATGNDVTTGPAAGSGGLGGGSGSTPAALWEPDQIGSLVLWLDAADTATITTSGSDVVGWADKSGSGNDAEQTVNVRRPGSGVTTLNGNNVISYDGSDAFLEGINSNRDWQDMFIVTRWDGAGTFPSFNGLFTARTTGSGSIGVIGRSGSSNYYTPNWFTTLRHDGTTRSVAGALGDLQTPTIVNATSASDLSVNGFALGSDRRLGGRSWNGIIAEVVVSDVPLSDAERELVEGYLAHKWGTASELPAGHPYRDAAPTL